MTDSIAKHFELLLKHVCPICKGGIPNDQAPGMYPGAISRRDNKTEICSNCGTVEAMDDWAKHIDDHRE